MYEDKAVKELALLSRSDSMGLKDVKRSSLRSKMVLSKMMQTAKRRVATAYEEAQ